LIDETKNIENELSKTLNKMEDYINNR